MPSRLLWRHCNVNVIVMLQSIDLLTFHTTHLYKPIRICRFRVPLGPHDHVDTLAVRESEKQQKRENYQECIKSLAFGKCGRRWFLWYCSLVQCYYWHCGCYQYALDKFLHELSIIDKPTFKTIIAWFGGESPCLIQHLPSYQMSEIVTRPQRASGQSITWWRHQMETFSVLLTICEGNPVVRWNAFSWCPIFTWIASDW